MSEQQRHHHPLQAVQPQSVLQRLWQPKRTNCPLSPLLCAGAIINHESAPISSSIKKQTSPPVARASDIREGKLLDDTLMSNFSEAACATLVAADQSDSEACGGGGGGGGSDVSIHHVLISPNFINFILITPREN